MSVIRPRPRQTAPKEAIRHALAQISGFISAQELHQRMGNDGTSVGLATVYRQLNALVEEQEADAISVAGGQLYRACKPGDHHHHLVCESCRKAVEIDPPSEEWIRAAAKKNGYTVIRHMIEIFGFCPECTAAQAQTK